MKSLNEHLLTFCTEEYIYITSPHCTIHLLTSMFDKSVKYASAAMNSHSFIDTLPLLAACRFLTPLLSSPSPPSPLCTPTFPVLPSSPHLLPFPHLTAYPGRTLGDSATGGCRQGLPVHGTAWSAKPLLLTRHFFPDIFALCWSKYFRRASLWMTPDKMQWTGLSWKWSMSESFSP